MSGDVRYTHSEGDRFEQPDNYFYSAYGGAAFIEAWRGARDVALAELPPAAPSVVPRAQLPGSAPYDCGELLDGILSALEHGADAERSGALDALARLTRRYEISKRLHDAYSSAWVPQGAKRSAAGHVRFADALAMAYVRSRSIPYLNALLKVMDRLLSVRGSLPAAERASLARIVLLERMLVEQLAATCDGPRGSR